MILYHYFIIKCSKQAKISLHSNDQVSLDEIDHNYSQFPEIRIITLSIGIRKLKRGEKGEQDSLLLELVIFFLIFSQIHFCKNIIYDSLL